ncbi:MAG: PLP-dependent cysteine synthase family protein [Gemmatimonadota bacterium]
MSDHGGGTRWRYRPPAAGRPVQRAAPPPPAPGALYETADLPAGARALVKRIGGTPLIPLPSPRPSVRIYGKAEWFNPGGSVKDRPAWAIVSEALAAGRIGRRRLLDASSGNTAIAYSMLGAAIGFGVTICLPASASRERRRTLDAYGAELVITDALEGSDGAIRWARELAGAEPDHYWYADQYGNAANWRAHYHSTAEEVWHQTRGGVTHFVAGLGTTGTLVGAGRRLRELNPGIRVIGVQPAEPLHGIEGLKHLETAIRPSIYDPAVPHAQVGVETEEAQARARRLAREAGILAGVSSGAAYAACLRVAAEVESGVIVTVLPDGGSRYLSESWWHE